MNENVRPPLGVKPKYIFDIEVNKIISVNGGTTTKHLNKIKRQRLEALKGAIMRYTKANLYVDMGWIIEYNVILSDLGVKENKFKL
jgi:hypothetical protein